MIETMTPLGREAGSDSVIDGDVSEAARPITTPCRVSQPSATCLHTMSIHMSTRVSTHVSTFRIAHAHRHARAHTCRHVRLAHACAGAETFFARTQAIAAHVAACRMSVSGVAGQRPNRGGTLHDGWHAVASGARQVASPPSIHFERGTQVSPALGMSPLGAAARGGRMDDEVRTGAPALPRVSTCVFHVHAQALFHACASARVRVYT